MVNNSTIKGPEVIKEYGIEFWGSGCYKNVLKIRKGLSIKFSNNIIFEKNLVYGTFIITK